MHTFIIMCHSHKHLLFTIGFYQPSKSSGIQFLLQAVISVMWTGKSGLHTTDPLVKFSAISTRLLQINHNILACLHLHTKLVGCD